VPSLHMKDVQIPNLYKHTFTLQRSNADIVQPEQIPQLLNEMQAVQHLLLGQPTHATNR